MARKTPTNPIGCGRMRKLVQCCRTNWRYGFRHRLDRLDPVGKAEEITVAYFLEWPMPFQYAKVKGTV
jgi:hypothetical protein